MTQRTEKEINAEYSQQCTALGDLVFKASLHFKRMKELNEEITLAKPREQTKEDKRGENQNIPS